MNDDWQALDLTQKIELKKKDIEKLQEKEKVLHATFVQSLGDNNKFADYLTKVFKKKIKRSKKKETTEGGELFEVFLLYGVSNSIITCLHSHCQVPMMKVKMNHQMMKIGQNQTKSQVQRVEVTTLTSALQDVISSSIMAPASYASGV